MKIGITGTRYGMTPFQEESFRAFVSKLKFPEVHHGSCQGVDVQAAKIIHELCCPWGQGVWVCVCHPGPNDNVDSSVDTSRLDPLNHLARNRAIVDAVDLLIVVPKEMERQQFGGTWYTFDYAIKKGKQTFIIWPDGVCES